LGAGRSTFTVRYINGVFVEKYDPEIEDEYRKLSEVDCGGNRKVQIYYTILDTVGREDTTEWNTFDGVFVLFDVCQPESLKVAETLLQTLSEYRKTQAPLSVMLIGNKVDLNESRKIGTRTGVQLAKKYSCGYKEVSSKTGGKRLFEAFDYLYLQFCQLNGVQETQKSKPKCTIS
jgi:GTPase SAR1 family protein